MDVLNDVVRQFKKSELLDIAKDIGCSVTDALRSTDIANKLIDHIHNMEELDVSDLTYEFLITAEIIDQDGNFLETKKEPESTPEVLPECFSFADERDPSCQKCKVYKKCMRKRTENRPQCFGLLFDTHIEECIACLEMTPCKSKLEERGK